MVRRSFPCRSSAMRNGGIRTVILMGICSEIKNEAKATDMMGSVTAGGQKQCNKVRRQHNVPLFHSLFHP